VSAAVATIGCTRETVRSGTMPDMPRLHLFELEDQSWFPAVLRDAATAYLRFAADATGLARRCVPAVREALERGGVRHIVDLCSGGAGPVPSIVAELAEQGVEVHATLTDAYPNVAEFARLGEASGGRIGFVGEAVDATAVPATLAGLRTLFNAFHHFRPEQARAILQDAVDADQPIAVFELVARHPASLVAMLFVWLPVMLVVPLLRPFRWSWLVFTYLVPLIPLLVVWDGLVSCLRLYSPAELRALIDQLDGGERFDWEIGEIPLPPVPAGATVLIGTPRTCATRAGE
jgi:hypothetical protein